MTRNDTRHFEGDLPEELLELLESTRPVEESLADLEAEPINLSWDPEFMTDRLKADIVEEILRAMEEAGMNKNQLAERLGKSRQWVTRVLNEGDNFTLATIAKIACALRCQPSIHLDRKTPVVWLQDNPTKEQLKTTSVIHSEG